MTTLREAAQQALEALEFYYDQHGEESDAKVITALKAALEADDGMYGAKALAKAYENGWNAAKAETVQEPVAWMMVNPKHQRLSKSLHWKPQTDWHITWESVPLYTAPPQRKPLTEEEISNIWDGHVVPVFGKNGINPIVFARAIEAKHGIGGQQ